MSLIHHQAISTESGVLSTADALWIAKGAGFYSNSLVNVNNPGVWDLGRYPGQPEPTVWSNTDGWYFDLERMLASEIQYTTGQCTVLARFSGLTPYPSGNYVRDLIGNGDDGGTNFIIIPLTENFGANDALFRPSPAEALRLVGTPYYSGTLGIAGLGAYANGALLGYVSTVTNVSVTGIGIGRRYGLGGTTNANHFAGYVQAAAVWTRVLDATEMTVATQEMQAL